MSHDVGLLVLRHTGLGRGREVALLAPELLAGGVALGVLNDR